LNGHGKTRTFSGASKAAVEVNLSFKVGGTIQTVHVKIGDKVKKGAPIASVDKKDFQLRTEQARAAVSNAKVQMQTAKSAFERTSALYENNNVSLQDFERAKTTYESARAGLNSAERGLQLAQSQLSYTGLNAPMDGIVTRVNVEKNENVMPGQSVVELHSGRDIEVVIGVPESYISRMSNGDLVTVSFPAVKGKSFKGTVTEVSYAISAKSSTYPVCVVLDNPSKEIRPGMSADVTFAFNTADKKPRIVIPIGTVAEGTDGRFVYTVSPQKEGLGLVRKKKVVTGELVSGGLEILDGLRDGELVVTAGISKLSDSMTVKLLTP
jgi:RND family efflux transporter MFP subunit